MKDNDKEKLSLMTSYHASFIRNAPLTRDVLSDIL